MLYYSIALISGYHRALTNLMLWLESDCITYSGGSCSTPSDGTSISTWSDQTGKRERFEQGFRHLHLPYFTDQRQSSSNIQLLPRSIANNISAVADHRLFL